MTTTKMLSVRQPWAHMIVNGHKNVENRTWGTNYRGPLLIHAGQNREVRWDVGNLLDDGYLTPRNTLRFGGIIGIVDLVDVVDDSRSRWANDGHIHWVLRNPRKVPFVKLKGMVGLLNQPWPLPASSPAVRTQCSAIVRELICGLSAVRVPTVT